MTEFTACVSWERGQQTFIDKRYSRAHKWEFDGGLTVPASASPHIVPLPMSVEYNVDPEEAFVASLSSCHMLFFLSIAAAERLQVESYRDNALGIMEKAGNGMTSITRVTLRPMIEFFNTQPSQEEVQKMHEKAHEMCFIANSVKTTIMIEPVTG